MCAAYVVDIIYAGWYGYELALDYGVSQGVYGKI